MAARLQPEFLRSPEIVDLRLVPVHELEATLAEETAFWRDELEWDFTNSAETIERFVEMRALTGAVAVANGKVAGYCYFILEDGKALIGDMYLLRALRTPAREAALISRALEQITAHPNIRRVESQLMTLPFERERLLPLADRLTRFEREFLRIDLSKAELRETTVRHPAYIEGWTDLHQPAAAQLIAEAYSGHVDSRINDQYQSPPGAQRFLRNIVQYPGCGAFFRPASFSAFEAWNGRLCGISLASLVGPQSGHITQICVSNSMRGKRIGYQLLRQSLASLRRVGCTSASLTVTAANKCAVDLYHSVGFKTVRRFPALVWEFEEPTSLPTSGVPWAG